MTNFDPTLYRIDNLVDPNMVVAPSVNVVPIQKPSKQQFVRVHPDAEYRFPTVVLELEETREHYLVAPNMRPELDGEYRRTVLMLAVHRGTQSPFLWPLKVSTDGKENTWNDSAGVAWTLDTNNTNAYGPNTSRPRTGSYSYRVEAKAAGFPYTNKYSDNRIRRTFSPSAYVISVTLYTSYSTVALCGNATLTLYKDGGSLAGIGSGTGWTTYTRAINALTSSIGLHTNVCANVSGKSTAFWDDISIQVWN